MRVLRHFIEKNFAQLEFLILQLVSCLRYEGPSFKDSELLAFLFKNVVKSPKLAAKFYWNIRIESETEIPSIRNMYLEIQDIFWKLLASKDKNHELIRELLGYQMQFRDTISKAFDVVRQHSGKSKDKKKEALRKFLSQKKEDVESLFENENFFVFKGERDQTCSSSSSSPKRPPCSAARPSRYWSSSETCTAPLPRSFTRSPTTSAATKSSCR